MSFAPLALATMQQKRSGRPFIIKVNYASGFTVTLPLSNGYNYNFIVDWGDGNVGQVTAYNDTDRIHTYASGGTYTITMTGTLEGWLGYSTGMKEYIIEVVQWGRTGFKYVTMSQYLGNKCDRLTSCSGKLITSQTNVTAMFWSCTAMTYCDVSEWDVSGFTVWGSYRDGMFQACTGLTTLDTANWRFSTVSNVTFDGVFGGCTNLTSIGDTSAWNTGKITSMTCTFRDSKISSLDVSGWDMSSCTHLGGTFARCTSLTSLDVSGWDVSKVVNWYCSWAAGGGTFQGCTGLTSLNTASWTFSSTSNIDFTSCFNSCTNLTTIGDTSGWNTGKFTTLYNSFYYCRKLSVLDVSGWDLSSCTSLFGTFYYCDTLTALDVSSWDVSKVTDFGDYRTGCFQSCTSLTSLNTASWTFNSTSNVRFDGVFQSCTNLTTIGSTTTWNTGKFTSLFQTFANCGKLTTLDVSGWDLSSCTNLGATFGSCTLLTSLDVSSWNVSKVTTFVGAWGVGTFQSCTSLTSLDTSGWVFSSTSNVTMTSIFNSCTNLTTIGDTSGWNTGKVITFRNSFYNCRSLNTLDVSGWDTSTCASFFGMFYYCDSLTTLDVSGWDVSACTNFGDYRTGMFQRCSALTSLDTSSWTFSSTSNVVFSGVFAYCTALTTIGDTSGWNTGKFTYLDHAFVACSSLTSLNVSGWDLSSCLNLAATFGGCSSLTSLDCSGWNVSKVTTFSYVWSGYTGTFSGCTGLTSLNVSGWTINTTTNVNMGGMFYNCTSLTSLAFTGWNTSKVTSFYQFLDGCTSLTTCDVSVLSTVACTNVAYMFRNCRSMTAIDISGWNLSLVTAANMTQYMFNGCYGLTSLTLPSSLSRVDNQFAVFGGSPPAITVYNINRSVAPTVSGTPFGNYAKPLHVPVSNSGYNVAPWTNTAIFSSIINDL